MSRSDRLSCSNTNPALIAGVNPPLKSESLKRTKVGKTLITRYKFRWRIILKPTYRKTAEIVWTESF
jgi:hypothetical protein